SQSLSTPSQVSVAAWAAVHPNHPVALHFWVPKHVPIEFAFVQLRIAPASSALHVQLAVRGWQYIPPCEPAASGAHV
ncbi:MAG: hypothetical protein ABI175_12540, partial [Polyangiales bacterium]